MHYISNYFKKCSGNYTPWEPFLIKVKLTVWDDKEYTVLEQSFFRVNHSTVCLQNTPPYSADHQPVMIDHADKYQATRPSRNAHRKQGPILVEEVVRLPPLVVTLWTLSFYIIQIQTTDFASVQLNDKLHYQRKKYSMNSFSRQVPVGRLMFSDQKYNSWFVLQLYHGFQGIYKYFSSTKLRFSSCTISRLLLLTIIFL